MTDPTGAGDTGPIDVVAAVVRRDDRYLIALRPEHKRHGGLWEFPGGKIDPGETREAATRRELDEELGVALRSVDPNERWARVDAGGRFRILFLDVEIEGEPRALEHTELRWSTVDELLGMRLAPTDAAFVRAALVDERPA